MILDWAQNDVAGLATQQPLAVFSWLSNETVTTDDIREQCLAALVTLLGTITGLTVARGRAVPATPADCPLLAVYGGTEGPAAEADVVLIQSAMVMVEGFVVAATDQALGPALNDLYGRVVEAVEGDKTLGGRALGVFERTLLTDTDRIAGHAPLGSFALTLEIRYQTRPADPFRAPL